MRFLPLGRSSFFLSLWCFWANWRGSKKMSEIEKVNKKVNSTVRFLFNPEGKCVKWRVVNSKRGRKHTWSDTWRLLRDGRTFCRHTVSRFHKCTDRREMEKSSERNECRKLKNANSFLLFEQKKKIAWGSMRLLFILPHCEGIWRLTSCLYETTVGPAALVAEVIECT